MQQQHQQYGQPPGAVNPYAAPVADAYAPTGQPGTPGQHFWRQGDLLVARKGTQLPDLCLATGVPTGGNMVHKKLQWYPPWTGILVILSPLIGLIVMLILRKKGELTYYISAEAAAKRKKGLFIGLGLVGFSILLLVVGIGAEAPALLMGFGLVMLIGIIVAIAVGLPYKVKRIDKELIYLQVKPAFWAATGM